ncbi:MAG: hypothetical protein ACI38Y_03750 [Candidatus Methanomethylophilaceae archaeon]
MDPRFKETRPVMPFQLTCVLAGVLVATVVFMVFSRYVLDTAMPGWAIPVVAVVFAVIIVLCLIGRFSVTVTDDAVDVQYFLKKIHIPMEEIIDRRAGEIAAIKSYDRWNLKGVKHKVCVAIGEDDGVALKLTGKRVLVLSSKDPQTLQDLLPRDDKE